jgi:Tol biopolymer transport system component
VRRSPLLVLIAAATAVAATAAGAQAPSSQVVSARLDGTDTRVLSPEGQYAGAAVPVPGGRIAYILGGIGATFWTMTEDGGEQRKLAAAPGDGEYGPAWSPDGRTLAVSNWDHSPCTPSLRNCAVSELSLVDVESGAVRRSLRSRGRGVGSLSWSPDGSRLAYLGELDMDLTAHTVETVRSDGAGRRVLVRLPRELLWDVAWSPRGDRIAYGRGGWIWVVRAEGGAGTRLVRGSAPVWSPRGDKLLFRSPRENSVGVVTVATRHTRVLAQGAELSLPSWSSDGRRIALEIRARGSSTLAVVRAADGRRLHTWAPGGDVRSLFFSRDGERLVYTRSSG